MVCRLKGLTVLGLLFLLSACAVPVIPYDRGANPVKTLAVLSPGWPTAGPTALLASSPAQSFGLVGALVGAAIQANLDSKFRDSIAPQNFDGQAIFRTKMIAALKARGYEVVEASARTDRTDFLADSYGNLAADAKPDAYLDCIVARFGYVAAGVSDAAPYRPFLGLRCRMTQAGGSTVLMRDTIIYNPLVNAAGFVGLSPDPAYVFTNSELLFADPAKAVMGMQDAIDRVTDALGTLLK